METLVKDFDERETVEAIEPFHFCHLTEELLWATDLRLIMPILEHIECEWGLNLMQLSDHEVANRILLNSVLNN